QVLTTTPLAGMKNLTRLKLNSTRVTDAGLLGVRKLKNLQTLDLTGARVTANGFRSIKAALPHTLVSGSPRIISSSSRPTLNTASVKVFVKGRLNNAAKIQLLGKLKSAAGIPLFTFYVIADQEDGTLFELSPVDDTKKLADQLVAAKLGKVSDVDVANRRLTLKLAKPTAKKKTKTKPKTGKTAQR
ncbi:MAG: hypothetical protein IID45_12475, partial [Planctomycetes bacterium]|nr:hypothetical protein [Planctomycetota bacterium]